MIYMVSFTLLPTGSYFRIGGDDCLYKKVDSASALCWPPLDMSKKYPGEYPGTKVRIHAPDELWVDPVDSVRWESMGD